MAIKGLHHNAYRCRDSEETGKFYEDFLGLPLAKALADPKVVAWAKDNDVTMLSKTPQQTVELVARQSAFFDKWRHLLVES